MNRPHHNIFSIPAGEPFAHALVSKILNDYQDKPEALADVILFLPTRRSCRIVQETFLSLSNNKAILLPKIRAIGDVDEEDLDFDLPDQSELKTSIKPAINKVKRKILLAKLINQMGYDYEHALKLSSALGHFMDQVYTEDLSLKDLDKLVPEDFAEHWQITLSFLQILSTAWPKILAEQGVIDAANRRNKLLNALCNKWEETPPKIPVIAAGTTGSIPAVSRLLSIISRLSNGTVVLPGYDHHMDNESWDNLEESHPQFGFKTLFEKMEIDRSIVRSWPIKEQDTIQEQRRVLAYEIMRPSETTSEWMKAKNNIDEALKNIEYCACENEYEEAQVIALKMREALEHPEKKVALVTPDRKLAKRVHADLLRWGWDIDDSAGDPLDKTSLGTFILIALDVAIENNRPVSLLSFLKNPFTRILNNEEIQNLELKVLRGLKPKNGFEDLYKRAESESGIIRNIQTLEVLFTPILNLKTGLHKFDSILKTHIELLENSSQEFEIWRSDLGQKISEFLQSLYNQSPSFPEMSLKTYKDILQHLMHLETYRKPFSINQRLQILGQLEARLIDADIVILSSLNEGVWPPAPGFDPWMSASMRKQYGLPSYERSIGLSAHDFVQGFCSKNILLTRAIKSEGAPTIPARWIQRLETVLSAYGTSIKKLQNVSYRKICAAIDKQNNNIKPLQRPQPKPPAPKRPGSLSATKIEVWMKDPYAIYAQYVLNLRKLDDIEKPVDSATTGTLLHEVLFEFLKQNPNDIPENSEAILYEMAVKKIEDQFGNFEDWSFWMSRFENVINWYVNHERSLRSQKQKPLKLESKGSIQISNFTISARIDRLDQTQYGLSIIDYKSAGNFSIKSIETGDRPQLCVEGLIAKHNGFNTGKNSTICELSYWVLKGSETDPGKVISVSQNIDEVLECTENGLNKFISVFNDEKTPYYSLPKPHKTLRYNDYEHLSRQKEWLVSDAEDAA